MNKVLENATCSLEQSNQRWRGVYASSFPSLLPLTTAPLGFSESDAGINAAVQTDVIMAVGSIDAEFAELPRSPRLVDS